MPRGFSRRGGHRVSVRELDHRVAQRLAELDKHVRKLVDVATRDDLVELAEQQLGVIARTLVLDQGA